MATEAVSLARSARARSIRKRFGVPRMAGEIDEGEVQRKLGRVDGSMDGIGGEEAVMTGR